MISLSDIPKIIKKIYSDIVTDNIEYTNKGRVSIYRGTIGLALFFEFLYHHKNNVGEKESVLEQISEQVSYSLNNLDRLEQNSALSGYTGGVWMLLVLKKQGVYNELDEYIEQLSNVIIESIKNDINHNNYDLLHGLLGKLLILGRAYDATSKQEMKAVITKSLSQGLEAIINSAIVLPQTQEAYWLNPRLHDDVVSVGLAHGQSSYIWALSIISQECNHFIQPDIQYKVKHTIHQACNFLIHRMLIERGKHTQVNLQNYFSVQQIVTPSDQHRLSWCNGGLGVCIALTRASECLGNKTIKKQTLAILKALSQIKKEDSNLLQEGRNIDCGMCHGTLGIFFIFYILHRKFGISELKTAYEYWLEQATESIDWNEPFLGMKVCDVQYINGKKVMSWSYMSGLLNGAAGYGLIFLSYYLLEKQQCQEKDLHWLSIFM